MSGNIYGITSNLMTIIAIAIANITTVNVSLSEADSLPKSNALGSVIRLLGFVSPPRSGCHTQHVCPIRGWVS